jgi:hypothetical protein
MILQNSFDVLNSITENLESNKLGIAPIENTYLTALYESSDYAIPMEGIPSLNDTAHDIVQDKIIEVVSKSLIDQLSFLRSEIIPAIDSFYEKLKNTLRSYSISNPLLDVAIVPCSIPEIVNNDYLSKLLDSHKELVPIEPIQVPLGMPNDELMTRVEEAARHYYEENYGNGPSDMDQFGNGIFANLKETIPYLSDKIISSQNHDILKEALTKFLVADVLDKNQDIAVDIYSTVSLDSLRDFINSVKRYALAIAARNLDIALSRQNDGKGLVILSYDKHNKTIYVDKVVYDNFLNAGGAPEVILGVFANSKSSPSDYFYSNLIEFKDKYIENFQQYSVIEEATRELNYFDSFKTFFRLTFLSDTANYTEYEKKYHDLNPGATEHILKLLDEKLNKLVLEDIKDPKTMYQTVTWILATSRFYYTDAHRLLNYINSEHSDDKDISSTVAIAAVYYLVDYFADQFAVIPA